MIDKHNNVILECQKSVEIIFSGFFVQIITEEPV